MLLAFHAMSLEVAKVRAPGGWRIALVCVGEIADEIAAPPRKAAPLGAARRAPGLEPGLTRTGRGAPLAGEP
ncbi:MAG TPA: hypothetical protein VKM54_20730 [Myxococcota bacterium]|nr:hypothetical protein [Myxococcota bacterium]